MYIDHILIENFRTFKKTKIDFCHADQDFVRLGMKKPSLPNVNLLLANNGFGKTSLLKAIALAALGPAVSRSGIYPYKLIRREAGKDQLSPSLIQAEFTTHEQDQAPVSIIESRIEVIPEGDLELLEWAQKDANGKLDEKAWHPVFSSKSDAFFVVGYGATRRVSKSRRMEQVSRSSARAGRVMSLFDEDFSLRPLNAWLPEYKADKRLKGRYTQAVELINTLVGKGNWEFTGKQDEDGEYVFGKKGVEVPFPALSDGYRAFLGWLGDLLFHICETCPDGKKLMENKGIVMVDEIDMHLHPKWQMTVLQTLAKELPNIQFIVTSHSPLIVGSLEWMNIILMKAGTKLSSTARRIEMPVHGLDADQVLLTDFFGMETTRSSARSRKLDVLSSKAAEGDEASAKELLKQMTQGKEAVL